MGQHRIESLELRLVARGTTEENRKFVGELFDNYHDTLMRFLVRRLGNADAAADMAEQVYARILQMSDIAHLKYPRAYLFQTARNFVQSKCAIHGQRSTSVHGDLGVVDLIPKDAAHQSFWQLKLELAAMRRAIDAMRPICQAVFVMHRFDGKSYRIIADELGLSVATVEQCVIEALHAVRREVARAREITDRPDAAE